MRFQTSLFSGPVAKGFCFFWGGGTDIFQPFLPAFLSV